MRVLAALSFEKVTRFLAAPTDVSHPDPMDNTQQLRTLVTQLQARVAALTEELQRLAAAQRLTPTDEKPGETRLRDGALAGQSAVHPMRRHCASTERNTVVEHHGSRVADRRLERTAVAA